MLKGYFKLTYFRGVCNISKASRRVKKNYRPAEINGGSI